MRRKVCKDCGAAKWQSAFYRHPNYADGHMNTCKQCKRQQVKENRELKWEHYREMKRRWSSRPENVAKRLAYRRTARGTEIHRASCRRYVRFRRMERQGAVL